MATKTVKPAATPSPAEEARAQVLASLPKAPVGQVTPVLPMEDYTKVTIVKSGALWDGHPFRRGQQLYVDASTLQALKAAKMV